jgi:hypothetical protein
MDHDVIVEPWLDRCRRFLENILQASGGSLHHGSEIPLNHGRLARLYWGCLALSTPTWFSL